MDRVNNKPKLFLSVLRRTKVAVREKTILYSLNVKIHGGFRWEASRLTGKYAWRAKPPMMSKILEERLIDNHARPGTIEHVKELNETEYIDLLLWRKELLRQLNKHKDNRLIASRIQKEVNKANLLHKAFIDWYLENGLEIPNIEVGDEANPPVKSPIDEDERAIRKIEVKVAPLKYLDKHFREVDREKRKGLTQTAAIEIVSKKYGFKEEGFGKQYQTRWLNRKVKMKKT